MDSVSDDDEDIIEEEDDEPMNGDRHLSSQEAGGSDTSMKKHFTAKRKPAATTEGDHPNETIIEKAGHVTDGISKAFSGAVDVTNQGINKVVGATTDLMVTAASNAPVLKGLVKPHVHR